LQKRELTAQLSEYLRWEYSQTVQDSNPNFEEGDFSQKVGGALDPDSSGANESPTVTHMWLKLARRDHVVCS
jgi:hypothetical protein